MLAQVERPLTKPERERLSVQIDSVGRWGRETVLRTMATSLVVCALLAGATVWASDAPAPVILGFWLVVATAIGLWSGLTEVRGTRRHVAALNASLTHGMVRETTVEATDLVELEEFEDEGACWAFQVAEAKVLFITGHQFYATEDFPNSSFQIIEPLLPNGLAVDEWLILKGAPLRPGRVIPAAEKITLEVPDHLEVVSCSLETLENCLAQSRA